MKTIAFILSLLPVGAQAGDISSGLYGGVRYFFDIEECAIALTIDDGPDRITTRKILDVLARHDARATFFLIAEHVRGNEEIVDAIVAAGHEIANHMTRDERSASLPIEVFEQELTHAERLFSRWADPGWFRPGSGWYNRDMVAIAKQHGYRTVLGTLYPLDAWIDSPALASRFLRAAAFPGGIIILHDRGQRGLNTVATLEKLLPELSEEGYRVVTLSTLQQIAESSHKTGACR